MTPIRSTLAALALCCTVATAPAFAQSAPEDAVRAVIGGQIDAFRAGAHETAFGFAAPSIRTMFGSTDRFISMVRSGYGAIYGAKRYDFGRTRVTRDTILQEVLITGPMDGQWTAIYTLRRQEDGSWKIAGVQMQKREGEAA